METNTAVFFGTIGNLIVWTAVLSFTLLCGIAIGDSNRRKIQEDRRRREIELDRNRIANKEAEEAATRAAIRREVDHMRYLLAKRNGVL